MFFTINSFTSPYSAAGYSSGGQGYGGQERERRSSWKAPKRKAPKSTGESLVQTVFVSSNSIHIIQLLGNMQTKIGI